jgi:hypothetical protein
MVKHVDGQNVEWDKRSTEKTLNSKKRRKDKDIFWKMLIFQILKVSTFESLNFIKSTKLRKNS